MTTDGSAAILVVEDDRALRESLVAALDRQGFEVAVAADGAAGVQRLREGRYDVVLLDIGLPFVDGWHVMATLDGPLPAVVVISARGDAGDKVRALDLGADDYLAKPFGTDELLARIRAVLRRVRPPVREPVAVTCGSVTVDLGARGVPERARGQAVADRVRPPGRAGRERGRGAGPPDAAPASLGPRLRRRTQLPADVRAAAAAQAGRRPGRPSVIVTAGSRGYRFGPPAA